MALVQIKVENQLLVPFGGPKWSIEGIRVVGVSTSGTYIESDTPLAYIDRSQEVGLRLRNFVEVMPGLWPEDADTRSALAMMHKHLADNCEVSTPDERRFLELYFDFVRERVTPSSFVSRNLDRAEWGAPYDDDRWAFAALMPLPQAHIYALNPLEEPASFVPSRMMKVDFAFWTGKQIVAVEIDGGSHIGSESHITKDRLLQRSGVHVVHILNSELKSFGMKVIRSLLPAEITRFWTGPDAKQAWNPFDRSIPF